MPHIHEKIDFVVDFYIVYRDKVLLIHHKKLLRWLCPGGHVELDEDTDQALFREIREETGLRKEDLEILSTKPEFVISETEDFKSLYPPHYMNIHRISDTHQHLALEYFFRAKTDTVRLSAGEHHAIKWFTESELDDPQYNIPENIKFYAKDALKKLAVKLQRKE